MGEKSLHLHTVAFFMGIDTKHCDGFKERIGKCVRNEINMKAAL